MKNRNYVSTIMLVLACGMFITSCKDEFDEEQLLLSQQDRADEIAQREADAEDALSAENAAALAAAQLLDYTITLHSDDVPAEGVAVNLTNNAGTTVSVTTDADGNAIFTGLSMGGHTVSISSSDFLDASYNVDFGTPIAGVNYQIIDGKVYPLGTNAESSKVELYSLSGMQTATLTGNVEIETDLTNNAPEVPQDITIRANLDGLTPTNSHSFIDEYNQNSSSIYVDGSFTFTEGDIGVATVDNTTGEYSMQVPATDDSAAIELLFPLVEADQTLGWSYENDEYVGAQVGTQAAVFGPDITASSTPDLFGVVAEFPEPEAPGRGFTVGNLERMPADLNANADDEGDTVFVDTFPLDALSGVRYRSNQGSGYQLTPTVAVSAPDLAGPDAVNAAIEAWMDWTLWSVAYAAQPALTYGINETITISVEISDENGIRDVYDLAEVNAEADGSLVAGSVDVDPMQLQAPNGDNLITTNYVVTSFNIAFTGNQASNPSGTLTRSGSVDRFAITDDGEGYTAIPTITVADAPNGGTNASIEIYEMSFKYSFDLDNTGVTQGYVVLPEVTFEVERIPGEFRTDSSVNLVTLDANGFVEGFNTLNPSLDTQANLTDGLMVSSNGNLAFNNDQFQNNSGAITNVDKGQTAFSYSMPRVIIVEPTHEQTTADVDVNDDGEVTGLSDISVGSGYTSEYDVTLVTQNGLAGAGAVLDLVDFTTTVATNEVTWGGAVNDVIVVERGSGYTDDVNIAEEPFLANQSITVRNGETKILNVNYGTGTPVANILDPNP
nr:carboxypeptidase-like regulatory domain-containing protein [uncultured Allomuricauda sp.]